jgi:HEPN domain-containing protein
MGRCCISDPEVIAETRRWFRYAQEDLVTAQSLVAVRNVAPRQICYLTQQAAEKALKATLVWLQIEFRKTHDLDELALLLPPGWGVSSLAASFSGLSAWAVRARYPGNWSEPTAGDAQESLADAVAIVNAVRDDLVGHGLDTSAVRL